MIRRSIRHFTAAAIAAIGALLLSSGAEAAVPTALTHQGRLFSEKGAPVNATLDVVFTIYDGEDAAGKALWTETHTVSFEDGYFSVSLGDKTALDGVVFDGAVRYLGIKVGADEEMTPPEQRLIGGDDSLAIAELPIAHTSPHAAVNLASTSSAMSKLA